MKQSYYLPEINVLILSSKVLKEKQPNLLIIFARGFADEIIKNNQELVKPVVDFVVPLPEPRIVNI